MELPQRQGRPAATSRPATLTCWLAVPPTQLPSGLRFLTVDGVPALLQFPPDMDRVPGLEPNRLSNQVLVHTFEEEWGRVHR